MPNILDLSHVVAEIEDVGQSQLNAANSFIRFIMARAIKCRADPDAPALLHWHAEMGNWQTELASRRTASMRHKTQLDREWRRAVRQAVLNLKAQGTVIAAVTVVLALETPCPLSLDDLSSDPADPVSLVERLKLSLASDR